MSPVPKIVGGAFNLAGLVAPQKAGQILASIFLTPIPRMPASEWPAELLAESNKTIIEVAGHSVQTWKFGDSKHKVVFCHGWGGCGANSRAILPKLLDAGFEVHAFDGPAHGDGKRRPTNLLEFGEVLTKLVAQHGRFDAAIGHSFGGGAIALALGLGFDVDRAVLIAPMIDSKEATDYFNDMLGLSERLRPHVHEALHQRFADNIDGWDLANWSKRHTTPARIFHDPNDHRVPYNAAVRTAENWENCTITPVADVGHHKILKDPAVIEDIIDFVATATSQR